MATVFTSTLIGWGLGGFVAVISLLADTSGQVNERTVFAATTGVGLAAGAILVASGRGLHLERPPGPFVMTMEGLLTGFCVGTAYAATQHRRMEDWGNEILVFTGIGTAAGLVLGLLDQPTAPPAADQPPPKVVIEPSPGGGLRVGARLNFTLKTN